MEIRSCRGREARAGRRNRVWRNPSVSPRVLVENDATPGRPALFRAELGDDDVLGGGQPDHASQHDLLDPTSKAFLVVGVFAELKELDLEWDLGNLHFIPQRPRDGL